MDTETRTRCTGILNGCVLGTLLDLALIAAVVALVRAVVA